MNNFALKSLPPHQVICWVRVRVEEELSCHQALMPVALDRLHKASFSLQSLPDPAQDVVFHITETLQQSPRIHSRHEPLFTCEEEKGNLNVFKNLDSFMCFPAVCVRSCVTHPA